MTVLELQDIPTFADRLADSTRAPSVLGNASPSRGKIRPGKELIILSDDANQGNSGGGSNEPPLSSESAQQEALSDSTEHQAVVTADVPSAANATKKFSALSMAERQAEWLRKKQEKMEAERSRQEEEKEKELTFQPKILRRSTLGDKPTKDAPASKPFQRSDSGNGGSARKLDISGTSEHQQQAKPSAGPKERAIPRVPPRSAGRRKKTVQVSPSQPIEISSDLLDSMKSELNASISRGAALSPSRVAPTASVVRSNSTNAAPEDAVHEYADSADKLESPEDQLHQACEQPVLKSWSDQPTIGGKRVDFDSSETKARLVLQDASRFELSSMYRKTDKKARRDGVALHMGRREDTLEEEVIAVLFDKEKVSELEAERWWHEHEHRFAEFIHELPPPMDFGS